MTTVLQLQIFLRLLCIIYRRCELLSALERHALGSLTCDAGAAQPAWRYCVRREVAKLRSAFSVRLTMTGRCLRACQDWSFYQKIRQDFS
ncbi:hypothetical protein MRB53_040463 [Persea americana]|nr:hypothetical protein MRB53_040463 [Persea americana]